MFIIFKGSMKYFVLFVYIDLSIFYGWDIVVCGILGIGFWVSIFYKLIYKWVKYSLRE